MNFAVILLVVSHLFAAGIFVERLRFTHGLLITLIFFLQFSIVWLLQPKSSILLEYEIYY